MVSVLAYKQPLFYNLAVAKELAKQIYVAEALQPPTVAAFKAAYASIWSQATSPAALRALAQSGQVAQVGIYGLQAYGIFKVRLTPLIHIPCRVMTCIEF